jgi:hypothetical protein
VRNPKYNRPLVGLMALAGCGLVYIIQNASSNDSPQSVFAASSVLALMLLSACGLFYFPWREFRLAPVRK